MGVLLVDKSDVFATFKTFIKRIHNEFETTIKKVRSDNGSVDRISSAVLRGVSHEGRLIGRDVCNREQEGNIDT